MTKERCKAPCPDSKPLLRCSRKKGHIGDHQCGYGGGNCAFWSQQPAPAMSLEEQLEALKEKLVHAEDQSNCSKVEASKLLDGLTIARHQLAEAQAREAHWLEMKAEIASWLEYVSDDLDTNHRYEYRGKVITLRKKVLATPAALPADLVALVQALQRIADSGQCLDPDPVEHVLGCNSMIHEPNCPSDLAEHTLMLPLAQAALHQSRG